jgi:hypothetical protein
MQVLQGCVPSQGTADDGSSMNRPCEIPARATHRADNPTGVLLNGIQVYLRPAFPHQATRPDDPVSLPSARATQAAIKKKKQRKKGARKRERLGILNESKAPQYGYRAHANI